MSWANVADALCQLCAEFCGKSLAMFWPIGILVLIMHGMSTIRLHINGLLGRLALLLRR
jgi:hypothetical protein